MVYVILSLVALAVGAGLTFLILNPRLKKVEQINTQIKYDNEALEVRNAALKLDKGNLEYEMKILETRKAEILNSINELTAQAEQSNQIIYEKSYALMQENLDQSANQLSQKFQAMQKNYEQEYLKTVEENSKEFELLISQKLEELAGIQQKLDEMRAKTTAAIEAQKREEEKQLELDKYKILISNLDLLEINKLREIVPYFRNARPIYKIIWESYYRNQTNDLINRVIGANTKMGIYKITNLTNGKGYVGQAVNIANRFKEHIKCGLGIDTPNNKLYSAMMETGVENFTFEILEECAKDVLNDREIYWINFYHTQDHGYNMTKGGARK